MFLEFRHKRLMIVEFRFCQFTLPNNNLQLQIFSVPLISVMTMFQKCLYQFAILLTIQ